MKPLVPFTFYLTYLTAILPIMLVLPLSGAYASENPPATTVIAISAPVSPVSPPVTPNSVTAQTRDQIAKIVFDDNLVKKPKVRFGKKNTPSTNLPRHGYKNGLKIFLKTNLPQARVTLVIPPR